MNILTVDELNKQVKNALNSLHTADITISGELLNVKGSKTHLYFTIQGKKTKLNGAYWNYVGDFKDGDKVHLTGYITLYEKTGQYQIIARRIEVIGQGELFTEQQLLKKEMELLGYFNKEKIIPKKVVNIGLITAVDGAAIKDFLYVLNTNNFIGNVFIRNGAVQGVKCPQSIADEIKFFNTYKNGILDIIIITRGGGSYDDLCGFSSREVVKAVYDSKKPVISAIGHEVDFMLSDYAADIRAPTPSIAGEIIVENNKRTLFLDDDIDIDNIEQQLNIRINEIHNKINNFIEQIENTNNCIIYSSNGNINNINDINNLGNNDVIKIKLNDGNIVQFKKKNIIV